MTDLINRIAPHLPDGPLGVALSGGGDSMAMLHLARKMGRDVAAVTVDHGLRDVRSELDLCRSACAQLGVPHDVLRWAWDGQGNVQARARDARRQLMAQWADARGIPAVLLAHTRDDQAETVLLRIARGSGVDGLAGMARRTGLWVRPLLDVTRAELRDWLRGQGIDWAEDPSNDDPRFDRVRARAMAAQLSDLGLTQDRLVQLADHALAARRSLRDVAITASRDLRHEGGDLIFPAALLDLRSDTPRRLLAAAIQWIGAQPYRPRWAALTHAIDSARADKQVTLAGCVIRAQSDGIRIGREPAACAAPVPAPGLWDGRWHMDGPPGSQIAALGEAGIAQIPDWRSCGVPRQTLLASPGLWQSGALIAAPVAGYGPYCAEMRPDFGSFLLSR